MTCIIDGLNEFCELELETIIQDGSVEDYSNWLVNLCQLMPSSNIPALPKSVAGRAKVEVRVDDCYESDEASETDDDHIEIDEENGHEDNRSVVDEDGFTLVQARRRR